MATVGKWVHSDHEESFSCLEEFDSREQAIAAFADCGCTDKCGCTGVAFWTGRIAVPPVDLNAKAVIENARDAAYESCGDAAEDWLANPTDEQVRGLATRLNEVWSAWLKELGEEPLFFAVESVMKHIVVKAA